jgi:hypothetical protein
MYSPFIMEKRDNDFVTNSGGPVPISATRRSSYVRSKLNNCIVCVAKINVL